MIVIGALFIVDKDKAIEVGFIITGIFLLIGGILPMIQGRTINVLGLLLIILGILLILAPELFTLVFEIIIGVIAIIIGALNMFAAFRETDKVGMFFGFVVGLLVIAAGVTIFLGMDIAFQIFGGLLIAAGLLDFIVAIKNVN